MQMGANLIAGALKSIETLDSAETRLLKEASFKIRLTKRIYVPFPLFILVKFPHLYFPLDVD